MTFMTLHNIIDKKCRIKHMKLNTFKLMFFTLIICRENIFNQLCFLHFQYFFYYQFISQTVMSEYKHIYVLISLPLICSWTFEQFYGSSILTFIIYCEFLFCGYQTVKVLKNNEMIFRVLSKTQITKLFSEYYQKHNRNRSQHTM